MGTRTRWKHIRNKYKELNQDSYIRQKNKRANTKGISSLLIINYILQWGKSLKRKEFQKID